MRRQISHILATSDWIWAEKSQLIHEPEKIYFSCLRKVWGEVHLIGFAGEGETAPCPNATAAALKAFEAGVVVLHLATSVLQLLTHSTAVLCCWCLHSHITQ